MEEKKNTNEKGVRIFVFFLFVFFKEKRKKSMPKLAPQQCVKVDQDVLALQRNWRGVKLKGEFYVNGLLEINDVYYTPPANVVSFCWIQCLCITETDCLFQANGKQLGF